MPETTIDEAVRRALEAYDRLGELSESIDDEWTFVTDLQAAWHARLTQLADARTGAVLPVEVVGAIDRAIEEIAAITDVHRAIDWLSTFPQLVVVALGERE